MNTYETNELQKELNELVTEEKRDVVVEVTGFSLFGDTLGTKNKDKE
jgi:hypothetical protein